MDSETSSAEPAVEFILACYVLEIIGILVTCYKAEFRSV